MKPIVSFFSVPVVGAPKVQSAINGKKFITFAVRSDASSKSKEDVARIICFETNPLFERVMNMNIRSGSVLNMTCTFKVKEKPAINVQAWNGLLNLCRNAHVEDRSLLAFLKGKKPNEPIIQTNIFFDVLSIDYAIDRRPAVPQQQGPKQEETAQAKNQSNAPVPPEKPLTLEGFHAS